MWFLNIVFFFCGVKLVLIVVVNVFIDVYWQMGVMFDVDMLNVWEEDLLDFDGDVIGVKYKGVVNVLMDEVEQLIW